MDLSAEGAIERMSSLFQGPLFLVPKNDSDKRRVSLDLSTLKFILCPRFKMVTVSEVRNLRSPVVFTTSFNLKDAYFHVPIKSYFLKYLGFHL